MNEDDRMMADLLGEAPRTPDPAFRFDVLAHVSERARRRKSLDRAFNRVALFSAIGLGFGVAQAAGVSWQGLEPMAMAGGVVATALLLAMLLIQGPRTVLARSQIILGGR
jgi:hypothetical protein